MANFHHFTTIVPFDVPGQLDIIETWHQAHGQPVYTLNHSREYEVLKPQLPDWVIPVERRFSQAFGRDYLPFTELLGAINERVSAPEDRVLFVNSDISIQDPAALGLLDDPEVDMFFASRMDVHPDGAIDRRYKFGYDVISLRNSAVGILEIPDFYVGLPWWDYVLPLSAIIGGYRVKRPTTEAFHHVLHPQRWSRVSFDYIGWNVMTRLLPEDLTAGPPSSERVQKFSEVANQFLNGKIAAGEEQHPPEEVKRLFLKRVANTPGIAPKKQTAPVSASGKADNETRTIAPSDPDQNAAFLDLLNQLNDLSDIDPVTVEAGHADLDRGLWLSCDPGGSAQMQLTPRNQDQPVRLTLKNGSSGGWACLGMQVDPQSLQHGQYFGLLMELDQDSSATLMPVLRYYPKEDLMVDIAFPEPIVLTGGNQPLLPFVPIDKDLAGRSTTCELNLFFDSDTAQLGIHKLEPVLMR